MLSEEILKIEYEEALINPCWYYHAFDSQNCSSIFQNGISCSLLTHKEHGYSNGLFYISLTKWPGDEEHNFCRSAFEKYSLYKPMLIVDKIKAVSCKKCFLIRPFRNTPIPIRHTAYDDEYQAFWKIEPENIIGISANLMIWSCLESEKKLKYLKNIRDILLTLKELDIDLPLYDYSREKNGTVHIVDKEKYLQLDSTLF